MSKVCRREQRARSLARRPGSHWRFQTGGSLKVHADPGPLKFEQRFDEVVVDDWLHAEMMDSRSCFVTVAGLSLWLKLTPTGAVVTHVEIRSEGSAGEQLGALLMREAADAAFRAPRIADGGTIQPQHRAKSSGALGTPHRGRGGR